MLEIFPDAFQLLVGNTGQLPDDGEYKPLSFAIASAGMGLIVVLLDIVTVMAGRQSFLKLAHGFPKSVWLIGKNSADRTNISTNRVDDVFTSFNAQKR